MQKSLDITFEETATVNWFDYQGERFGIFRPHLNPYSQPPEVDGVKVFAPKEALYYEAGYRYFKLI